VALPVSWGSSSLVLPSLTGLSLQLPGTGQLPAEWARGFRKLASLVISGMAWTVPQGRIATVYDWCPREGPGTGGRLPPQWAAGFPALANLQLTCLNMEGPIPQEWMAGFPALQDL